MAEEASGALSGATTGAQAGAIFGPVGAVVGGILGGIAGLVGGGKAKKAKKFARYAQKTDQMMQYMEAGIQRRDLIRNIRSQRAMAVAGAAATGEGGLMGSAVQGAVSSIGSQGAFGLRYFDARIADSINRNRYLAKAGKYATQSQQIMSGLSLVGSAVSLGKGIYDQHQASKPPPSPTVSPPVGGYYGTGGA